MSLMIGKPKVSIGMPVYNGEELIRQVLDALLSQTFTDFELIISDNASTDSTESICHEYAAKDSRVRYERQPKNLGPYLNMKFVLDCARGEYFMWAADDDIRSENFLEETVSLLDSQPVCVAATTPDCMEGEGAIRDFELMGAVWERFFAFMKYCWVSHGLFYSLVRTNIVRKFDVSEFDALGGDWNFIMFLASQGEVRRAKHGLTIFSTSGVSNSERCFSYARKNMIHWFVPFFGFSKYTWGLSGALPVLKRIMLLALILKLNVVAAKMQLRHEVALRLRGRFVFASGEAK